MLPFKETYIVDIQRNLHCCHSEKLIMLPFRETYIAAIQVSILKFYYSNILLLSVCRLINVNN